MKAQIHIFITLLVLTLTGCYQSPILTKHPVPIQAEGTFQHEQSGIYFPIQFKEFKRDEIHKYDKQGRNIGVGYNLIRENSLIAATIYVYPIPHSSFGSPENVIDTAIRYLYENHYKRVEQSILDHHQNSKVLDVYNFRYGRKNGRISTFEYTENFAGEFQPLFSILGLYTWEKWYIKFRITQPKNSKIDDQYFIQYFLQHIAEGPKS